MTKGRRDHVVPAPLRRRCGCRSQRRAVRPGGRRSGAPRRAWCASAAGSSPARGRGRGCRRPRGSSRGDWSSTKLRSKLTTPRARISPITRRTMPSPIPMCVSLGCATRVASRATCPWAEGYPRPGGSIRVVGQIVRAGERSGAAPPGGGTAPLRRAGRVRTALSSRSISDRSVASAIARSAVSFGSTLRAKNCAAGDLALVERLVLGADLAAELARSATSAPTQQQPGADDVAERHQQPGGVQADLVDVAGLPPSALRVGRHQVVDQRADDRLGVLQARSRAARARP